MSENKTIKGIDLSTHNGHIDFSVLDVDFAIIRAGYGRLVSQKDARFEENYNGLKSRKIPTGAYWYSYAKSESEAIQEAKAFLQVIKGKQFEMPVYFDLEEASQFALGKSAVSKIIRAFLETVEKEGYFVGLYMSAYYLSTYVEDDIKKRYAIWVAHYGVQKPSYNGDYGIWQYSSTGKVNGISGNVDMNVCYQDYVSSIVTFGFNGFTAMVDEPKHPDIVEETINGSFSDDTVFTELIDRYTYVIDGEEMCLGDSGKLYNRKELVEISHKPIKYLTEKEVDVVLDFGTDVSPSTGAMFVPNREIDLYVSSTAKTPTRKIKVGEYDKLYLYDNKIINGRIRITNSKERVGATPVGQNVTGWIYFTRNDFATE